MANGNATYQPMNLNTLQYQQPLSNIYRPNSSFNNTYTNRGMSLGDTGQLDYGALIACLITTIAQTMPEILREEPQQTNVVTAPAFSGGGRPQLQISSMYPQRRGYLGR